MNERLDFETIRKEMPEFKDRVEVGMRMMTQLLEEHENVLMVSFTLEEEGEEEGRGKIESVLHTCPGIAEDVLVAALRFYQKDEAVRKEKVVSPN